MKPAYVCAAAAAVLLIGAAAWLTKPIPLDDPSVTQRYDHHFKKYNKRYFSVLFDWRWFKAQSMAESSLKRGVVSERGAVGIMQVLPDTFNEVMDDYADPYHIVDPRWNIAAGVAFNRYLYDRWRDWVPPEQSLKFTFASYNSGLTRMLNVKERAAADGLDSDRWMTVAPYAPGQTRHYVKRIHALMGHELPTP